MNSRGAMPASGSPRRWRISAQPLIRSVLAALGASLKIPRDPVFGGKIGWGGVTKENTLHGSSTEEQRSQATFTAKTRRARRVFCRLPSLAQPLQPALGMLNGQSSLDPRRLGTRQNPSPQDPAQFSDWLSDGCRASRIVRPRWCGRFSRSRRSSIGATNFVRYQAWPMPPGLVVE